LKTFIKQLQSAGKVVILRQVLLLSLLRNQQGGVAAMELHMHCST
jgi:hypothetical protein